MSRELLAGTTNHSTVIRIIDSTDGTPETGVTSATAGLAFNFRRTASAAVAITALNDLALLTTAHTDGGILHIGNGYYRLDFQDAAFAAGATDVLLTGTATGMVVIGELYELVLYDSQDAVRLGLTALPAAAADAAGGLPISDAGGLDLDTILDAAISTRSDFDETTDPVELLDSGGAAGTSADELVDDVWDEVLTGATHNVTNSSGRRLRQISAFVVASGTAQAGTAGTITLAAGESATDDIFAGDRVIIVGGTGESEHGLITTYNGTTKVATMSENWVITPDATSEYELVPADVDVHTWDHIAVTNSAGNRPEVEAVLISVAAAQTIRDEILPTQNVAFDNIEFLLVAASDHVTPVTGATGLAVTRSIDGGAFGAGTGTLAEIASGIYQYDASAADMNGGIITFRFVATGGTPGAADDRFLTIITGGGV